MVWSEGWQVLLSHYIIIILLVLLAMFVCDFYKNCYTYEVI